MNTKQLDNNSQLLDVRHSVQFNQFISNGFHSLNPLELPAVKFGIEASQRWPQGRNARLANLRAQIEAGTYRVESKVLAVRILSNETHFCTVQAH